VPLGPPQTPHVARTRTRAAAVGSQRLTAWATARPQLDVFPLALLDTALQLDVFPIAVLATALQLDVFPLALVATAFS
jgi:hypothetical protein